MKKIYLQPTMNVGAMMTLGLIAASKWTVTTDDYTGTDKNSESGLGGDLNPGNGTGNTGFGAKVFYSGFDSEW